MTTTLRCYTGTNAATESADLDAIALMDIDAATNDPTHNKIAVPGYSYEKWLAVKFDDAGGKSFTNFWLERTGDLPEGVVIKMGTSSTGKTPVATKSTIATETVAAGRHYIWDTDIYDTSGTRTVYLVLQAQVAAGAASGNLDQQAFTIGYSQS